MSEELLGRILTAMAGVFVGLAAWCVAGGDPLGGVFCAISGVSAWMLGAP